MKKPLRIRSIDLLKIICVLIVFLCHGWLLPRGNIKTFIDNATGRALEIFFITSGCFITIKYKDTSYKTKDFFLHELKKVYPEYLISHLIIFIYEAILFLRGNLYPEISVHKEYWIYASKKLLVSIFMLNSWVPHEDYIYAFNGVGWFLSSLMFCYLITPFILRRLRRTSTPVLWLFFVITIRALYISIYHYSGSNNWLYWLSVIPVYRLFEYLSGVCVGLIFLDREMRIHNTGIQLLSAGFFILMVVNDCFVGSFGSVFICFDLLLVIGWIFYSGEMDTIAGLKINNLLLKILLPFYLFHQIVIKIYKYVCGLNSINVFEKGLIHMLIMFCVTLMVCVILLKYKNRKFRMMCKRK